MLNYSDSSTIGSQVKKLKEQIKNELTENCLPTLTYVDAYWNDETKYVYLFSTSKIQILKWLDF